MTEEREEGLIQECGECECKLVDEVYINIHTPKEVAMLDRAIWSHDDTFCSECYDKLGYKKEDEKESWMTLVECGGCGGFDYAFNITTYLEPPYTKLCKKCWT
jgi:hypothetical protein